MRRLVAAVVVGWLTVLPAAAEPLSREQVPEALRPWTDWVMHGHEEAFCSSSRARRIIASARGRLA